MQRRALLRHIEIRIAIFGQCVHIHSEIEQLSNPIRIPNAGELRQRLTSLRH